ncbi:MAG TPA: 6,7-dimethyl-8-ribityllumazine synthase [Acidimicrobiales bacterium]|nr:6,7-dimethyl-8-ribityllumazine synthase [Acidimicrobiales bacterium]
MTTYEGQRTGKGLRIGVVVSRFNDLVTGLLLEGTLDELGQLGVDQESVTVAHVPGAFELPLVAQRLASSGDHDAVICLGAVIRGETDHHIHVGGQAAAGCQRVQLDTGVPVVLGVLTTDTLEQALARAGAGPATEPDAGTADPNSVGHGHKGRDSAVAAVEMADLLRQLPKPGA